MAVQQRSLSKDEHAFQNTVWSFYEQSGRHELSWRKTHDPYKIIVSELMLQQTQVSRVVPKYREFLRLFPTARRLAAAPLGDVLKAWQGLGYNRRAKFLWLAAQTVTNDLKGKWPKDHRDLQRLPGIGSYTAGAVMNFAYNVPVPLIETNIRTVYLHHFFQDKAEVSDAELLPFIERTLDHKRPREWNWALMDYGAHLKTTIGNVSVRSKTYKKQSPFKESNRYLRGAILRLLVSGSHTETEIQAKLVPIEPERIREQMSALLEEGLIQKTKKKYSL